MDRAKHKSHGYPTLIPVLLVPVRVTGSIALLLLLLVSALVSAEHVLKELELGIDCAREQQQTAERQWVVHIDMTVRRWARRFGTAVKR